MPSFLAPIERAVSRAFSNAGKTSVSGAGADGALRSIEVSRPDTCRDRARKLVHKYAVAGTTWAILPIPVATSLGLTAMETHLLYWIGRIYGENPSSMDVAMTAGSLELASVALKTAAVEAANAVPVIGWGVKGAIAGSAIEAIGDLAIRHYEQKYPGKLA
ncbi:MAG TPA: hypothetical protein VGI39_18640 [Polyangiaceae bacterium]|jgi:uncharacterized protein (DUF697 family)